MYERVYALSRQLVGQIQVKAAQARSSRSSLDLTGLLTSAQSLLAQANGIEASDTAPRKSSIWRVPRRTTGTHIKLDLEPQVYQSDSVKLAQWQALVSQMQTIVRQAPAGPAKSALTDSLTLVETEVKSLVDALTRSTH